MAGRAHAKPAPGLMLVGVVGAARGLQGEVRVKSFTADPADLAAYGPLTDATGTKTYKVRVTGQAKGQVLARFDGVGDRNGADALRGTELYVKRSQLPALEEGEYYLSDLVGLETVLESGETWGRVVLADDFGAGTVLEVELTGGKLVMVPFTDAVVPVVDLDQGRLVVVPPEGLLEPGEPEPAEKEA